MADYLTVAEVYRMQHRLIEMFGGLHGVRDKGTVEFSSADWLLQLTAALMESLGNNRGLVDGNKRIAFTAADVFLRRNRFYIEVEGVDGHGFICGSMERHEFGLILDWIRQNIKLLL